MLFGEGGVESGAGGEDAGDFAADDFFGELGVFHLVADGDAVAFAEKAIEVVFSGVVGDAAHGELAFAVAGGEGELELAAGGDGVVVEELVEIAHAEEEEGVGIFTLGRGPLAHEGGEFGVFGWGFFVWISVGREERGGVFIGRRSQAGVAEGFCSGSGWGLSLITC